MRTVHNEHHKKASGTDFFSDTARIFRFFPVMGLNLPSAKVAANKGHQPKLSSWSWNHFLDPARCTFARCRSSIMPMRNSQTSYIVISVSEAIIVDCMYTSYAIRGVPVLLYTYASTLSRLSYCLFTSSTYKHLLPATGLTVGMLWNEVSYG